MEKLCFYDTKEVFEDELTAVEEKWITDKQTEKEVVNKFTEFLKSELLLIVDECEDIEKLKDRLEYTIEKENGEIWVMAKAISINRLQKLFETEP